LVFGVTGVNFNFAELPVQAEAPDKHLLTLENIPMNGYNSRHE